MRSRWLFRFGKDLRIYLFYELPDRNIITSALNVSIALKYCSRQVSLARSQWITTLLSSAPWRVTLPPARKLYTSVVSSGGTTMCMGFLGPHDEGIGVGSIHDEINVATQGI